VLCVIGSTHFSKVETTSNAAAHLTGFFFIERCGRIPLKTVGATIVSRETWFTICEDTWFTTYTTNKFGAKA